MSMNQVLGSLVFEVFSLWNSCDLEALVKAIYFTKEATEVGDIKWLAYLPTK